MAETVIDNVSDTAFWVANYRATETDRPDALFRDPLARRLAGSRGEGIAASMPSGGFTRWSVVIRTVIIDNFVTRAIADGVDLVLNLGAGLDTRPYRMELPRTLTWVEADFPNVIDFKNRELAGETPRCKLERVKVDLTNTERRREFLAQQNARARKILVITEGVVLYLTNDDVAALADDLNAAGNIAYWIVDYFSNEAVKFRERSGITKKLQNAPFRFLPGNWFDFFATRGWKPNEMRYLAEEGWRLKRPAPLPWFFKLLMRVSILFASQEKRTEAGRLVGYAMLERAVSHTRA